VDEAVDRFWPLINPDSWAIATLKWCGETQPTPPETSPHIGTRQTASITETLRAPDAGDTYRDSYTQMQVWESHG